MNTTAINILWMILVGIIVLIVVIVISMVIFKAYRAGLRDGISWSQSGDA